MFRRTIIVSERIAFRIRISEREARREALHHAALGHRRTVEQEQLALQVALGPEAPIQGDSGIRLQDLDIVDEIEAGRDRVGDDEADPPGSVEAEIAHIGAVDVGLEEDFRPSGDEDCDFRNDGWIVRRDPTADGVSAV